MLLLTPGHRIPCHTLDHEVVELNWRTGNVCLMSQFHFRGNGVSNVNELLMRSTGPLNTS